jgi:alkylated DNA repair dioxygenase AlkB
MIEGLSYMESFLTADEQRTLLAHLESLSFYPDTFLGKDTKWVRAQFGHIYGSTGRTLAPTVSFPPFRQQLEDKVRSACGSNPQPFTQCIVTRYNAGSGIGWHIDAPSFGDCICGVSLGAPGRLQFRAGKTAPVEFELAVHSGSLYCMRGVVRWRYQHRVPSLKASRHSLTFRTVRGGGEMTTTPLMI